MERETEKMTVKEAIKIISDYEELGCGFCHCGGDEVPQAFDMAVKALEAWDDLLQWLDMIRPKTYPRTKGWIECIKQIYKEHMKGDFYQPPLTNQQMLATISAAEFLAKINWLFHDYGKRYADSNLAIMEWLDSEVKDEQTKR